MADASVSPIPLSRSVAVGGLALNLRDLRPQDATAVVALHRQVFGPGADAPWFAWKYGPSTEQGLGQGVGAWQGDALVACCAGLPRTLWRAGESVRGLQIGDVMVHPDWRGILTRRGAFFHASESFYASRLGAAPGRPFQVGFGFPSQRHLRLAALLKLLHDGGSVDALHWPVQQAPELALPWHWRWRAIDPAHPRFDRVVDAAWHTMRAAAGRWTIGQRDANYLRWRYALRPPVAPQAPARYRFFELTRAWPFAGSGLAVLDLRAATACWLDWVGPLDWMPMASRACRLEAARCGATGLSAWASPPVAQGLAGTGIARRELCAGFGMPLASDLHPDQSTCSGWWMMGGDTDFL